MNQMEKTCEQCGGVFKAPAKKRRFCSVPCYATFNTKSERRSCRSCGKEFTATQSQIRDGYGKYCSRKCAGRALKGKPRPERPSGPPKTRMVFYNQNGWLKFRADLIEGKSCTCGATDNLVGHHVVDPWPTLDVGLLLDPKNIHVMCKPCHTSHHHTTRVTSTCAHCGNDFGHIASRQAKYCNMACRDADWAAANKTCPICAVVFKPKKTTTVTCSRTCGLRHTANQKLARRPTITCATCANDFTVIPARMKHNPKYCSVACMGVGQRGSTYRPMLPKRP